MATGEAFTDAVTLATARPALAVGCHIVLTDGIPVLPPQEIPSLMEGSHVRPHFRDKLGSFVRDLMLGRLNEAEIEREAIAQIRKLQDAGIAVSHIDSHKHTHLFPAIVRPLARAAAACGVHALRNPFEPQWSPGSMMRVLQLRALNSLREPFFQQFDEDTFATTEGTLGISATGDLDAETLHGLLALMPEGAWELVCHPGYNDAALDAVTTRLRQHREIEYNALLTEIPQALRNYPELQLISYRDVHPIPEEAS